MRITYHILGLVAAGFLMTGCQRKNEILEPVKLMKGGIGGHGRLNITVQHHKENINEGVVYIKYGANEMPDPSVGFDMVDTIDFSLGRPGVSFEGLTQGDYYLYAVGTDFELEPGNNQVMGGAHYRLLYNDTLDATYDLYLQTDNESHHNK